MTRSTETTRAGFSRAVVVLAIIAGSMCAQPRSGYGEEGGSPEMVFRRTLPAADARSATSHKRPADDAANDGSGSVAREPSAGDALDELRSEIRRLRGEVDRLKQTRPEYRPAGQIDRLEQTGAVFVRPPPPAALFDEGAYEARPLLRYRSLFEEDSRRILEDDPIDQDVPDPSNDSSIQLIQFDEASEFGAIPGQRLLPRRKETFGSIAIPVLPEYKPDVREYKPDMPARRRKLEADFGEGLGVRTDDDYFTLTFHNLTQVDFRGFVPSGDPLHDNFVIPRQRWYVLGNVTPFIRYYTVINRGYGTIDVLDAWADVALPAIEPEKLMLRVGRMKTPYTYEYIKIAENDLIAAERSVFVGNMAPNREIGIMAHGQLLDRKVEYALGLFNGPRRSFEDFNSGKDLFTYVSARPFLDGDTEWLRNTNIGGSWNWGNEHNPVQPFALRTANDQSTSSAAANVSPTFFYFDPNAIESGTRMQWSADLAWYYKNCGLLAGYQGGYQYYALAADPPPNVRDIRAGTQAFVGVNGTGATRVPMTGYSAAFFWFITGEEVTRRVELLEPRKEYSTSRFFEGNIGAIELFSRYAFMSLGSNVFSAGLADQSISSNRATVLDNGFNWYLTHYTKFTFEWQYAFYGNPVWLTPTTTTGHNNLFWTRLQIFF
ncbi:MAG TPA: hypothetical protein VL475_14835 [Planctomycetaceae bacterium]|jgi:phosphate-selective porin OprO/OprP|nr:hypothetical protein [Planctomycetaceae bacterium]